MDHCPTCGYELGDGRYCTNCGGRIDAEAWRTDTAERTRPRVAPTPAGPPPPAWTPPPPARFPLYADEADHPDHADHRGGPEPTTQLRLPAEPAAYADPAPPPRRRRSWGLWAAGVAVLLVVTAVGVALVAGGDDPDPAAARSGPDAEGINLASGASVRVPATAGPGRDVEGNQVLFDAENMLDGVPETAWRMAGSGQGKRIVVTLPVESRLRSVGLINGYAKSAEDVDWYAGNRRIERVEWVFDDGTTLTQDLDDDRGVQSVEVDVTTTKVVLRLLEVSEPGRGPSYRDYTAISELSLVGGAG